MTALIRSNRYGVGACDGIREIDHRSPPLKYLLVKMMHTKLTDKLLEYAEPYFQAYIRDVLTKDITLRSRANKSR
jgi:hypothetical protein